MRVNATITTAAVRWTTQPTAAARTQPCRLDHDIAARLSARTVRQGQRGLRTGPLTETTSIAVRSRRHPHTAQPQFSGGEKPYRSAARLRVSRATGGQADTGVAGRIHTSTHMRPPATCGGRIVAVVGVQSSRGKPHAACGLLLAEGAYATRCRTRRGTDTTVARPCSGGGASCCSTPSAVHGPAA